MKLLLLLLLLLPLLLQKRVLLDREELAVRVRRLGVLQLRRRLVVLLERVLRMLRDMLLLVLQMRELVVLQVVLLLVLRRRRREWLLWLAREGLPGRQCAPVCHCRIMSCSDVAARALGSTRGGAMAAALLRASGGVGRGSVVVLVAGTAREREIEVRFGLVSNSKWKGAISQLPVSCAHAHRATKSGSTSTSGSNK